MNEFKSPTSDIVLFKKQLENPNKQIMNEVINDSSSMKKLEKFLIISLVSDASGCGHIRNIFPMTFLNAEFGGSGKMKLLLSPIPIMQQEALVITRSIYFQRYMNEKQFGIVKHYKDFQSKYRYKMVYDLDDFLWSGDDDGEGIPDYNFCKSNITDNEKRYSIEIMNMMDTVCVSTDFLKDYIVNKLKVKTPVIVIPNTVPKYFWGLKNKKPITERLKKPKVIYTGSPTHYNNDLKLKGDWDNAWYDWVMKNVKDKKIEFVCMGGLPYFFEELVGYDNFKTIKWVNSYQYHLPIINEAPDFGISPLVPNYFNYGKSDLKYIEYCAGGMIGIGTYFNNGKPSPYDNNIVKVSNDASIDKIDELFWECCEPDVYNSVIERQFKMLDNDGRWLESPTYIKKLTSIL